MKKTYKYCTVVPKFREADFWYYLDCSGRVEKGSCVIAPFGNNEIIGQVTEVGYYEEENVPWPVAEMKSIHCIITKKEYDEYTYAEYLGEDETDRYELFEGERVCIKKEYLIGKIVDKRWNEYYHEYMYKVEPEKTKENWQHISYTCYELEIVKIIGKIRYIGDIINSRIEQNKVYEVFGSFDINTPRVINNGEVCLYNLECRYSTFFPDRLMKWEIVEDIDGKLSQALNTPYSKTCW